MTRGAGIRIGGIEAPVRFSSKEAAVAYVQKHLSPVTAQALAGAALVVRPV